ncbi:hypothetical protein [Methylobacterium hispanicum]|nr:hypothetical protein [Methylobacterium hispanicum]
MSAGSVLSHFDGMFQGFAGGLGSALAQGRAARAEADAADRQAARTLDRVATVARGMARDRQEIHALREENDRLRDELAAMRARAVRAEAVAIRDRRQP